MEFRQMRRECQQLSQAECVEIMERNTAGVLAVSGDGGYPYAVPLSYVYVDGKIIFHCAKSGHKLDAIMREEKASFCVIDQDQIVPEKYTTYYRSVIAFGRVRALETESEIREAIEPLAKKYHPQGSAEGQRREIDGAMPRLCMLRLDVEHMTGKAAIELVKERAKSE